MIGLPTPCLCAVTARRRLCPDARTAREEVRALRAFVDELIAAEVDVLQIREVDLPSHLLREVVTGAVQASLDRSTRVIVSSDVELALAAAADGVHLKEADERVAADLRGRAPGLIIGRSHHDPASTIEADLDYVVFGTIYPTVSKPEGAVAGPDALARIAGRSSVPVWAIGGITPANAAPCLVAGARGVVAIGAFLPPGAAPDAIGVSRAVAAFRQVFAR